MDITISSKNPMALADAEAYVEAQLQETRCQKTVGQIQGTVSFQTELDASAGENLLKAVLASFPEVYVSGYVSYGSTDPNRDASWWNVCRFSTVTEADGTNRLERQIDTYWA